MKKDEDFSDISTNRLKILNALIILCGLIIGVRLFRTQVLDGEKYSAKAVRQQIARSEISAKRGTVYVDEEYGDAYPVASNIFYYSVSVVPKSVKDHRLVAKSLAPLIGVDEETIYKKIHNNRMYLPPLKKKLGKSVAEKISKLDLTGVYVTPELARLYTEGPMLGHTLGFVDSEGNGNYGVEAYYHEAMEGTKGVKVSSQDAGGNTIATLKTEIKEQNGADIYLMIEHNVQNKAEEVIAQAVKDYEADKGTIMIMDVKTGGLVTIANTPSYDPNNFPLVAKDTPDLFRNPAVSEVWEPGSIMKPLVMGIALDLGLLTPETTGDYGSCVTVKNYPICTATKKAFGHETMTQVLENSDNVAMVDVSNKIGNMEMYKYLGLLGFGEKTKIDLQGEAAGSLLDEKKWRDLNRATISFGQGMASTPLQMLAAYAAVANKGVLIKPHVAKELRTDDNLVVIEKEEVRRVFKEQSALDLTQMLISVVEKGHGKKAGVKGYWVAGKTGTAQIPDPKGGYYEDKHIGSFAGFFPADNPRFAMLVKVDNPKNTQWAESSAAPTFGQMAQWLLTYYRIAPNR